METSRFDPLSDQFQYARRVADVECAVERLERKIVAMEIDANSSKQRFNAVVDFYEHRVDQIYRQVVNELGRAIGTGLVVADTEAEIDLKLTRIFGQALKDAPNKIAAHLASALTNEIGIGRIDSPLTLAGFRLDRSRCRETGTGIEIFPKQERGSGVAVFGPYRRLKPGPYVLISSIRISNLIMAIGTIRSGTVEIDVYSAKLDRVMGFTRINARRLLIGSSVYVKFDWSSDAATGPVEFRVHQRSNFALTLEHFELKRGN